MDTQKIGKATSLVVAVILLVLMFYHPGWENVGIYSGCDFSNRLLYPFFHANFLHFSLNVWCFLSIIFLYRISVIDIAISYIISVLAPIDLLGFTGSWVNTPTIGLSGVVYALLGINSLSVGRKLYYQLLIIGYMLIAFIIPNTNVWIHLYCYLVGLAVAILKTPLNWRKDND